MSKYLCRSCVHYKKDDCSDWKYSLALITECKDYKNYNGTIRTDNSHMLVNAEKRIRDLESQLSEASDRVEMNIASKERAFDKIHKLESQRAQLLTELKKIVYASDGVSVEGVDLKIACDMIREIEGGR